MLRQPRRAEAHKPQVKDPVDIKMQEALRERDAIIRNLLERVSELEWRVNGGFTSAAKADERPVITGSANSRVINSLTSTNSVVELCLRYDRAPGDGGSGPGFDHTRQFVAAFGTT